MLAEVRAHDSFVTCHKTLGTGRPGAICKGSDEAFQSTLSPVAHRLDRVEEITEAMLADEALVWSPDDPR